MKRSAIKIIAVAAFGFGILASSCDSRQEMEETYREDAAGGTSEAILEASDDSNSVNQGQTGGTLFGEKDTTDAN